LSIIISNQQYLITVQILTTPPDAAAVLAADAELPLTWRLRNETTGAESMKACGGAPGEVGLKT
jgi:hypothetical protein